jgi:hypothetical protein
MAIQMQILFMAQLDMMRFMLVVEMIPFTLAAGTTM